jgi:hypothetical protein
MMQIAIVLMITATISYYILPMIKPLHYWQSTGIFFCLVVAYIAATRERRVYRPLPPAQPTGQRPAPSAVDPVTQLTQMMEAMNQVAPAFVPPTAPAKAPANTSTQEREVKPEVFLIKPEATRGTNEYLMYAEIEAINATFAAHGIGARIHYLPTEDVPTPFIETPSFFGYRLVRRINQKIDPIVKLNLELSATVTNVRNKLGYKGSTLVRIAEFPTAIEVRRPDPLPLIYRNVEVAPMTALVGRVYGFDGESDVLIDLRRDHHVLFAGMSGYGKSNAMRVGLTSLVTNNGFAEIKFLLADLKGKDLGLFANLPNVIDYTNTPEGAYKMIKQAITFMEERQSMRVYPYRIVFAIDELAEVPKEMRPQLARLLNLGRDMAINVWGGTQYPTGKEIGENIPQAFTVRLVTRVAEATSARFVAGVPGSGAEQIDTPGDFLIVRSGRVERLRMFELSRENNAMMIDQMALPEPEDEPTGDTSNVPTQVAEVFRKYYNPETGDLDRGGRAAAKRALFGAKNVAEKGRRATEQAAAVNEHFQRWKQSL